MHVERRWSLLSYTAASCRDKHDRRVAGGKKKTVGLKAGVDVPAEMRLDVCGKRSRQLTESGPSAKPRHCDVDQQLLAPLHSDIIPVPVIGDLPN